MSKTAVIDNNDVIMTIRSHVFVLLFYIICNYVFIKVMILSKGLDLRAQALA